MILPSAFPKIPYRSPRTTSGWSVMLFAAGFETCSKKGECFFRNEGVSILQRLCTRLHMEILRSLEPMTDMKVLSAEMVLIMPATARSINNTEVRATKMKALKSTGLFPKKGCMIKKKLGTRLSATEIIPQTFTKFIRTTNIVTLVPQMIIKLGSKLCSGTSATS